MLRLAPGSIPNHAPMHPSPQIPGALRAAMAPANRRSQPLYARASVICHGS
jgi:hypothetical protein